MDGVTPPRVGDTSALIGGELRMLNEESGDRIGEADRAAAAPLMDCAASWWSACTMSANDTKLSRRGSMGSTAPYDDTESSAAMVCGALPGSNGAASSLCPLEAGAREEDKVRHHGSLVRTSEHQGE